MSVEAVPMYNLKRGPEAGKLFHDKGRGNGYVVTFGDKRFYLSGDTECTPEMKALAEHRRRLRVHEPAVHDAAGRGRGVRQGVQAQGALSRTTTATPNLDELDKALARRAGVEVRRRNWY